MRTVIRPPWNGKEQYMRRVIECDRTEDAVMN